MHEVAAYSTLAIMLGLIVARPTVGQKFRLTPAMTAFAGVMFLLTLGIVKPAHWAQAAANLWTPFVAIAAIMVMTEVARRTGLLEWWALLIDARATSTLKLFRMIFVLGVITSTSFNNDAAILILTPVVVALVRRRYPNRPGLAVPFAFAVFMSAGVAALPVSNPMNMVVAEFAGISFNQYASHMIPVAIAGWVATYLLLRVVFMRTLAVPLENMTQPLPSSTRPQRWMMVLLSGVLLSYPIFGSLGSPVWPVAVAGAALSLLLAKSHLKSDVTNLVRAGISWETLAFLCFVLIISYGLNEVGLVSRLTSLYRGTGLAVVGLTSALGSAILNNHPMALINMMALEGVPTPHRQLVFAALVGGDLGPRLLPMGSLAGLLWLESLRRQGIDLSIPAFVRTGLMVAIPTIAVSLAILSLY
jgi:arsenical pump membrane protein